MDVQTLKDFTNADPEEMHSQLAELIGGARIAIERQRLLLDANELNRQRIDSLLNTIDKLNVLHREDEERINTLAASMGGADGPGEVARLTTQKKRLMERVEQYVKDAVSAEETISQLTMANTKLEQERDYA
jgi:hypothetical protein